MMRVRACAVLALLAVAAVTGGCRSSAGTAQPWTPRVVIMVALDTCRADHLGCYGHARDTSPNIDRLARQGVLFERAFSQANESLLSYASIFSAQYPQRIGPMSYDFRFPQSVPTLPSLLSAQGVRTGAFVAGGHLHHDFGFGRGFEVYRDEWDFGSFYNTMPLALSWLTQLKGNEHAFMLAHTYDPHVPYVNPLFGEIFDPDYKGVADKILQRPPGVDSIAGDVYVKCEPLTRFLSFTKEGQSIIDPVVFKRIEQEAAVPAKGVKLTSRDLQHIDAHYDACIAYADLWVGLLMARIQALGLERETLVIIFGDHGEDMREHGFYNHRIAVSDSCTHVPLIVWGPGGIGGGKRVAQVVQLIDMVPTVLEMLHLSPLEKADGRSLVSLLQGTASSSADAKAFSEGLLPMMTVRAPDARLVVESHSKDPMPPPGSDKTRFYTIDAAGREREGDRGSARARELYDAIARWRDQLR
ncbi:MAG: hypothetical protein EB084_14030 [Proteobacteria bacterium]|nr:hypothetical protein [Pseudomonadota bacterium]